MIPSAFQRGPLLQLAIADECQHSTAGATSAIPTGAHAQYENVLANANCFIDLNGSVKWTRAYDTSIRVESNRDNCVSREVIIDELQWTRRLKSVRPKLVSRKGMQRLNGVEVLGEYSMKLSAARVCRRDLQRAAHRLVARLQVPELYVHKSLKYKFLRTSCGKVS